ncbi:MAG: hypothetical protein NTU94_17290 [Planctomycetota bacterium]|nr:hypothetical protein [Planctomycetota bacterium]
MIQTSRQSSDQSITPRKHRKSELPDTLTFLRALHSGAKGMKPRSEADFFVPSDVLAYIDTLAVWLTRKPRRQVLDCLSALCGSRHVKPGKAWWDPRYRCRLVLQQPLAEAILLLREFALPCDPPILVNEVHVALDLGKAASFLQIPLLTAGQGFSSVTVISR